MLINNNMDIQNDTGRPFGELVTEEGVKYLAEEIKATGLGPTKGLLGFPNTKPTNLVNLFEYSILFFNQNNFEKCSKYLKTGHTNIR